MALLGTLTLDLSAPTAQLSRDLDRAQQLAREAASKMSGIKPVWGIASSLHDEMRASRSILNSSLKAIESDAKGYRSIESNTKDRRPMARAGVELDNPEIDTRVQSLETEFNQRSAYLNQQVITPQVDDSQLTALNKHLSLKEQHLDAVVAKFESTKITPSVATDLTSNDTSKSPTNQPRNSGGSSKEQAKEFANEIGKQTGDSISKAMRSSSIAGSIKALTSPISSIWRGSLEGLGKELTAGLANSFSSQLGDGFANTFGSAGLVGRKIAQYVGNKGSVLLETVSREYMGEGNTLGQISQEITSALGEKEVAIEANAIRDNVFQKQDERVKKARRGVVREVRSASPSFDDAVTDYNQTFENNKPELVRLDRELANQESIQARVSKIQTKGIQKQTPDPELEKARLDAIKDKATEKLRKNLLKKGVAPEVVENRVANAYYQLDDQQNKSIDSSANGDYNPVMSMKAGRVKIRSEQKAAVIKSEIDKIQGQLSEKESIARIAQRRLNQSRKQMDLLQEKRLPEPIQRMIDEIAPGLPETKVPAFVSGSGLDTTKANADYSAALNRIRLAPDIYQRVMSGKKLNQKDYKTVREELEHAKDFKFGDFKGFQASQEYKLLEESRIKFTAEEERSVAPDLLNYDEKMRPIERNAKIKRDRAYKKDVERQNLEFVSEVGGVGGTSIAAFSKKRGAAATEKLGKIQSVATGKGFQLPAFGKIANRVAQLESEATEIANRVSQAIAGDLSPDKIEQLKKDLGTYIQSFNSVTNRVEKVKEATLKIATNPEGYSFKATSTGSLPQKLDRSIRNGVKKAKDSIVGEDGLANKLIIGTRKVVDAIQPAVSIVADAYEFVQGVEDAFMPEGSIGAKAKSFAQTVVLPTVAYHALPMAGPVGQAAQSMISAGGSELLSLASGGAIDTAAAAVSGSMASVPIVGNALASIGATAVGGAVDAATVVVAPIAAGIGAKIIGSGVASAGKLSEKRKAKRENTKAIAPADIRTAREKGQGTGAAAINSAAKVKSTTAKAAQQIRNSIVSTEIEQLAPQLTGNNQAQLLLDDGSNLWDDIPTVIAEGQNPKPKKSQKPKTKKATVVKNSTTDWRSQANSKITDLYEKIEQSIQSRNKAVADGLLGKLTQEIADFTRFNLGTKDELTPSQKGIATKRVKAWENKKADAARRIELIDDDEQGFDDVTFQESTGRNNANNISRLGTFQTKSINSVRQVFGLNPTNAKSTQKPNQPKLFGNPAAPTPSSSNEPDSEFKYNLFDRLRAASPFRRNRKRKYDVNQDPEAAGFEALASGQKALDRFDRAESSIKKKEADNLHNMQNPIGDGGSGGGGGGGGGIKLLGFASTALSELVGLGKRALSTFGAFTALSLGVPAMISLGKSTFDTAANFERLQVKLAAASDSAQSGKQKFAQLSATADNLGISRSSALETGAYIGGTTFGTQLDGAPSDAITKQILQVAQARGLSKQETDGLNLALGQTLGRSRTSSQEINQLTQSAGITDARAIAARGLGMTAAQFSQIQSSPAGIDSKRFVQAFLAQAVQDSQSGKALAQDSVGFKQVGLKAVAERTAGNLGAPMMPVVKLALDGLSSALKLFNDGLERSSGLLTGLAVGGIAAIGIQAMTSGTVLNSVLGMTANTIRAVGSAAFGTLPPLSTIGTGMLKLSVAMAGMAIAGEIYSQVFEITKNQSQDLADAASKIGEASRESGKEEGLSKEGEKQTTSEIGGRNWGESATLALQRSNSFVARSAANLFSPITGKRDTDYTDASFGIDNKQKESNDRKIVAAQIVFASNQRMLKTGEAIAAAKSITQIDLDLSRIDTERSGLFSGGNPDGTKIAALDAEYQKKTGERQKAIDNITPQKTDLQNAINANKGGVAKLNKELADEQIIRSEYDEQLKGYNQTIKALELNMRDLNAAIQSSFDNLQPWLTTLSKIAAKFEDIGVASNTSRERLAISRNAGEINGKLTRGGSERQAVYDNDRIISAEIKARKSVINELKGTLGNLDRNNIANVQKSYGLTDDSSSAQIKIAAGNATSINDKTTLEKLAIIKEELLKVATLDATLSNSHNETYRRIYAENRETALYYTQLSQQIDPKGVMFTKNISAITAEKARFMAKLQNYGTGGFDVYTTAIIDLMDLAKERMTALAKLAADKKAAIDARTNRNNDIAGKRQNDFDTTPGTQQPSVGKVSGVVQKDGNAQSSQSVDTMLPTTEPLLPPKTIKVKRSKTFVDANGYTNSTNPQIQSSIRAQLSKMPKADVDRYLNTTLAIGSRTYDANGRPNGYTNLATDAWEQKYLGAPKKPGGKWTGGRSTKDGEQPFQDTFSNIPATRSSKLQRSKITVNYEEEIANPEYEKAVIARNKRKAVKNALQPATDKVTPSSGGRLTTGQLLDKSQVASDRIYQEANDRADATFSEFASVEALKQNQIRLKAERELRLAKQATAKQLRDQESTQLNAVPAISTQDTQKRETLNQRNALADNRDSVSNARIDMASQIQNIEVLNAVFNQLSQKKNLTQAENAILEQLKTAAPKLSKDLSEYRQALDKLRASEAGLPANDAKAIATLQANHKYQSEVSKEREEQDRRASEITQDRTKLSDIDGQLINAPLDQDKLKKQREFNKQVVIKQAEITRIEEDRKVTERERADATYYPKMAESARKRNREIEQNTIKNAENKQAQESVKAKNIINQEFAAADIAELKLDQASGVLGVRFAQSQDKIDAPFANTKALDLELQQKLLAIENAKVERNKGFEQQRIKYAGGSEANIKLLTSLDRQKIEADRQSEVEKKIVETDSRIEVRGVQSQRNSYLYGQQKAVFNQQIGIFDAQTTSDKQRGQDTQDREYTSAIKRKQSEYSQQKFDLRQQRDAITGLTPEAESARNSIDALILGLKQMESIELSNIANQFDRFNQVLGETQKNTQSVLEKFVKTGKFDWKSLLRTPLEGGISQIMSQVTSSLFGGLYRKNLPAESQLQSAITPQVRSITPQVQSIAPQSTYSQDYSNITPAQPTTPRSSMIGPDGMANIPIPGGGNYRVTPDQAISEGFMRLDGTSTSEPDIKITPLEPQTIGAPEVTIEPITPQTIPAPQLIADDNSFDVQQLPLKGRSNIVDFKPKFNPNLVTPPPMPVNQFEGMPGYVVPKSQQRSSGGDAMSLLSMIPGLGGAGKYMGLLGKLGGLFGMGFADGGMVPSDSKFSEFRQGNDPIGAALRKEGANSVIAALTPGERVLTVSESRYYETMFPQGIKGYADGGVVGNIKPIPLNLDQSRIDNRGDSNEFNFDIKNGGGNDAKMTKENLREMENAVVAVLLKQKRARTGLVPN